jgi:hypothetical protein
MVYIRDKWIIIYLSSIIFYLFLRYCDVYGEYSLYSDHLCILYMIYGIVFFLVNSRLFVMSRRRLSRLINRLGTEVGLRYKTEESNGMIRRIYIQLCCDGYPDWYELDYSLSGLEMGCGYNVYNTFKAYNCTLGDLMHTMCHLANDKIIGERYRQMKTDYNIYKILSYCALFIFTIFYILILTSVVWSYEEVVVLYELLGIY